ncbi:MAG: NAD-binding protein [Streptosporangiales bacterium]|nr:NAD-binding protein [Streptosporangiales bacterium]
MNMGTGPVGFIGLGNIGGPMALTLLRSGHQVWVYDVRPEAVGPCVAAGARAAAAPREIAAECDLVGVAVLSDAQVEDVVAGEDGLLDAAGPGKVVVVHSTVLPRTVVDLDERAARAGVGLVDAPVSGGDMAARAGTLTVMAGGRPEDLERCRPYFTAIGERVDLVGGVGSGAAMKLALQLMTYCNQLAVLESTRLAEAYGIEESKLVDLATATTADSWIIRNWGFFDRLMREHRLAGSDEMYQIFGKDLFDVVLAAREAGVSLPVAGLSAQALASSFRSRYESLASRDES